MLELFKALIDPAKSFQEAMTWVVPIPSKYHCDPYSKYAKDLLADGAVPLGLLRVSDGPLPFANCATPGNSALKLDPSDFVFVLAPVAWAAQHLAQPAFSSKVDEM